MKNQKRMRRGKWLNILLPIKCVKCSESQRLHYGVGKLKMKNWVYFYIEHTIKYGEPFFTVGIEGNNCKIRHRIRRGFRRSCNFSKKIENHFKAFDLTFFTSIMASFNVSILFETPPRFKIKLECAIIIAHNEYIERSDCASLRTARQTK